jgi:hypothetical protein
MMTVRSTVCLSSLAIVLLGCPDDGPPITTGGVAAETAKPAATSSATTSALPASSPAASSAAAAPSAPARPLYYERAVEDGDLDKRTLRELSLMRNTIFARAGNHFRRPWLHAHFEAQDWYAAKEKMDESKITKLDHENAKKIATHDSAIPKADLEQRRDEVLARKKAGKSLPEDAVELSLLSQRLGTWLGDSTPTPLEDQTQLDRLLKIEELSTLSRRDLRILRNTIYARHGRSFDSKVVRSYFASASWYEPKPDFDDGMLTGIDHKNIKIIRSVEDSLGGPEHENPNYGKDGWFIMA